MTSERVSALSLEDEEDAALGYYDDEDDLEAFSDAELGCEDGGRRIFVRLRKVTRRRGARGDGPVSAQLRSVCCSDVSV